MDFIDRPHPRCSVKRRAEAKKQREFWPEVIELVVSSLINVRCHFSLKGTHASCYMSCSCDRKLCRKLWEIMNKTFFCLFVCFLSCQNASFSLGAFMPQRGRSMHVGGGWGWVGGGGGGQGRK